MTLAAFQQALCELIRSPEACLDVRAGGAGFLGGYELSPRERARLEDIVWQRGMSTNCTLHRMNRVTPIYTLLHYTCLVLGDALQDTLEDYWAASALHDLEFKHEIHRFARFLRDRVERAASADPFVLEVLEFEIAVNELRFAPRRDILAGLQRRGGDARDTPGIHPLMRVVRFRHDPAALLASLAGGTVPRELPEVESFLLLSRLDEELSATPLEMPLAQALRDLQREPRLVPDEALDGLIAAGVVVHWPLIRAAREDQGLA